MEEGKKMVKRKIQEEEEDDEEEEDQEEQQEWLHPEREVEETDTSDNEEEEDDQTRGMGGRTDNRRLITFLKATRRGKIRKIVREIYLRDDIPCGLRGCCFCYPEPEDDRREEEDHDGSIQGGRINEIERRGEGGGRGDRGVLNMDERILIFDSQALLDHIDFLQEDPSATNCLILSSVLSQVKHTNVQTYSTLRALCRQSTEEDEDAGKENFSSRHLSSSSNSLKAGNERGSIASSSSSSSSSRPFFIFSNEFFRPTFVDRREEETLEEKDRRGMWKAARWYS
ncbi:rnb family domain-containing protein, partial [Cystoisospora suis]